MAEEVEVTPEGIQGERFPSTLEPTSSQSSKPLAPPAWTQRFDNDYYTSGESDDDDEEWSSEDSSSYAARSRHKQNGGGSCSKRGVLLCLFTIMLAAIIAGVAVAVVIPMQKRSTNTAAANNNNGGNTQQTEPTNPPTTKEGLAEACNPAYNNVDFCLSNELTEEEGNACIDCVWEWLPNNTVENCAQTEQVVCNVLNQCGCGPCAPFLEEYLDCQSGCDFKCDFDTATERESEP